MVSVAKQFLFLPCLYKTDKASYSVLRIITMILFPTIYSYVNTQLEDHELITYFVTKILKIIYIS